MASALTAPNRKHSTRQAKEEAEYGGDAPAAESPRLTAFGPRRCSREQKFKPSDTHHLTRYAVSFPAPVTLQSPPPYPLALFTELWGYTPTMSLVQLANVCSHLQNASLARLGLTSIPHSRMHLNLTVQLQKQGFLSTVVLGGPAPPRKLLPPSSNHGDLQFQTPKTQSPTDDDTTSTDAEAAFPLNDLFPASNLSPSSQLLLRQEAHLTPSLVTQANRASRRLWLGLKYWDGEPVLRKMKMLSKPTQRLWVTHEDLSKIVRGKRANYVEGLTRIGECLFISTDKGVMEARECVERKIGGLVLCRVWG